MHRGGRGRVYLVVSALENCLYWRILAAPRMRARGSLIASLSVKELRQMYPSCRFIVPASRYLFLFPLFSPMPMLQHIPSSLLSPSVFFDRGERKHTSRRLDRQERMRMRFALGPVFLREKKDESRILLHYVTVYFILFLL